MRRILFFLLITLTNAVLAATSSPSNQLIEITRKDLDKYWTIAQERMGPRLPTLRDVFARFPDGIWLDYTVTIDSNGDPANFVAHSVEPGNAPIERLQRAIMFVRYKPTPENIDAKAVRFRVRERFWMPKGDIDFPK